jgi:tetratricopeptide (TPR) repeat protein
MTQAQEQAAKVIGLARAGDTAGAIRAGEAILAAGSGDPGLTLFVGVLCCRQGELARGIGHLRRAVDLAPGEPMAKIELARALLANGDNAEAEAVASPLASLASPAGREMQRVRAHATLREGRAEEARGLFEALAGADGNDFESWDGLGLARLALGDAKGAIVALTRATGLRPTAIGYWINLARAHGAAHDPDAAVAAARKAVALAPDDGSTQLALGRALAAQGEKPAALTCLAAAKARVTGPEMLTEIADLEFTCNAFDASEADYRAALAARPELRQAWLGLGKLVERTNRTAELFDLLDQAEQAGVSPEDTALLRARALRSDGRLEEALASAFRSPEAIDTAARAQLIGEIADRLGDADGAFVAFSEANEALAAAWEGSAERAAEYRDTFQRLTDLVTPEWYARWPAPHPPGPRRAPLFIFGFPRSGTTLIDTMLSGHPDAVVLEEEPPIDAVAKKLGAFEQLPGMPAADVDRLRDFYLAEVDKVAPDAGGRLIVDKHPLALGSTPLLHRLMPEARYIFVERHPCDVVLSCFITSAQMDANIANFFDFTGTALLYDRVLTFWERCRAVLPLQVHVVRYERLIADPETELRALAEFAGLEWTPQLLAHQSNASARAYIGSPSYAQVAEPIYTRARGRWLRYRRHMAPVLPILAPWAERMGYSLED